MQGVPEWRCEHPFHRHAVRYDGTAIAIARSRELARSVVLLLVTGPSAGGHDRMPARATRYHYEMAL